jgi:hypothetical protein
VQVRTVRNSECYRKSRSLLTETLTPVPQTRRRLFLKKQNKVLLQYHSLLCLRFSCKCSCVQPCICSSETTLCCGYTVVIVRDFDVSLMR